MTFRNILYFIISSLILILGFISHLQIKTDSIFVMSILSLSNFVFWVYFIWILFFRKRTVRKKIGKVVEKVYPLFEEEKYDDAIELLNDIVKKSYFPLVTKFAYAHIVLAYMNKEDLDKVRNYLNNKFIRNHYLLVNARVIIALYDNDIEEAKKINEKHYQISNKMYGQAKLEYLEILNLNKRLITMIETKVVDEDLLKETKKNYIKDLCLGINRE